LKTRDGVITMEVHVHHGLKYSTYDNYGATRCEWHSCTYNVYDSFDSPEEIILNNDDNEE
jgi:hypothetical protein